MTLLIMIALLPLVPALLPKCWALFGFACLALFFGLLWLDLHVQPYGGDGSAIGMAVFCLWVVVGAAGLTTVFLRAPVRYLFRHLIKDVDRPTNMALWPFPLGVLLAVFFMHWASNRLAGASPAWAIHLGMAIATLATAWLLWRFQPKPGLWRDTQKVIFTGAFASSIWVCGLAVEAQRTAVRADTIAGGTPYCVLTFAGRDHPRSVRNFLELSRLVSRIGAARLLTTPIGSSSRHRMEG